MDIIPDVHERIGEFINCNSHPHVKVAYDGGALGNNNSM
jgi:hypothetical protein